MCSVFTDPPTVLCLLWQTFIYFMLAYLWGIRGTVVACWKAAQRQAIDPEPEA